MKLDDYDIHRLEENLQDLRNTVKDWDKEVQNFLSRFEDPDAYTHNAHTEPFYKLLKIMLTTMFQMLPEEKAGPSAADKADNFIFEYVSVMVSFAQQARNVNGDLFKLLQECDEAIEKVDKDLDNEEENCGAEMHDGPIFFHDNQLKSVPLDLYGKPRTHLVSDYILGLKDFPFDAWQDLSLAEICNYLNCEKQYVFHKGTSISCLTGKRIFERYKDHPSGALNKAYCSGYMLKNFIDKSLIENETYKFYKPLKLNGNPDLQKYLDYQNLDAWPLDMDKEYTLEFLQEFTNKTKFSLYYYKTYGFLYPCKREPIPGTRQFINYHTGREIFDFINYIYEIGPSEEKKEEPVNFIYEIDKDKEC